ncbi:MAG: IS21 family transposase, partial [Bifidobacteriaceae bacterium]|nr:IS21 family transposase [Bifidobacteriaceae bacterium]
MEQFEDIRRAGDGGVSVRGLAREFGVHRRTVRQALGDPVPPARKAPAPRDRPVTGPVEAVVREWLTADLTAPRKQRHTAKRVRDRLAVERGVAMSDRTCRELVARLRAEIGPAKDADVPQAHPAGAEGEADFGEFWAEVDGVMVKLWLFVLRLSASGAVFARAYSNQAQEAFSGGHVRAFAAFGGVPGRIRYDNLKGAVVDVLRGRDRREHERFIA